MSGWSVIFWILFAAMGLYFDFFALFVLVMMTSKNFVLSFAELHQVQAWQYILVGLACLIYYFGMKAFADYFPKTTIIFQISILIFYIFFIHTYNTLTLVLKPENTLFVSKLDWLNETISYIFWIGVTLLSFFRRLYILELDYIVYLVDLDDVKDLFLLPFKPFIYILKLVSKK